MAMNSTPTYVWQRMPVFVVPGFFAWRGLTSCCPTLHSGGFRELQWRGDTAPRVASALLRGRQLASRDVEDNKYVRMFAEVALRIRRR